MNREKMSWVSAAGCGRGLGCRHQRFAEPLSAVPMEPQPPCSSQGGEPGECSVAPSGASIALGAAGTWRRFAIIIERLAPARAPERSFQQKSESEEMRKVFFNCFSFPITPYYDEAPERNMNALTLISSSLKSSMARLSNAHLSVENGLAERVQATEKELEETHIWDALLISDADLISF